jgi:N-acetylmuramoyl-L-alanine amidase
MPLARDGNSGTILVSSILTKFGKIKQMSTNSNPPPPFSTRKETPPVRKNSLSLTWVLLVAAIAATMFTAWTEPGLLPGGFAQTFSNAMPDFSGTPQANWPTPTARPRPVVGIVAGHSGNDSGAVCPPELNNTREVDINLDVANRVRTNLQSQGIDAELLAEFDDRLQGYRANALVSIHSDSCVYVNNEATGYKVAAALSNTYPEQAQRLTNCLRARYAETTQMVFHSGSVTNDMTSYHAFDEINPLTPSAIIEIGFMNLDYMKLTTEQDVIAQGVTNGILCFLLNETVAPENKP